MALLGHENMKLSLYNYVNFVKNKVDKPHEPKVEYQIPIGIVKRVMQQNYIVLRCICK
jgi:hypothetical protein